MSRSVFFFFLCLFFLIEVEGVPAASADEDSPVMRKEHCKCLTEQGRFPKHGEATMTYTKGRILSPVEPAYWPHL
jgi:hypothetical protein